MTINISSGRIYITDATNGVVFDTAGGMFRGINFADGFVDMPSRTATSTSTTVSPIVNVDTTYTLASIDASCTDVMGMVQFSRTPASGMPASHADMSGAWHAVNGSKLDFQWFCGPQSSLIPETDMIYCCGMGWVTFTVSGGVLSMREQIALRAPQSAFSSVTWTSTRAATRVFYKLYCGSFV